MQGTTAGSSVKHIKESSYTPAGTMVAENAAKPNWDPAIEGAEAQVRKAAVTVKVSDEMLSDIPGTQGYLNARLPHMVSIAEDTSLISGNGVAPAHLGILSTPGLLTQPKGADTAIDARTKP